MKLSKKLPLAFLGMAGIPITAIIVGIFFIHSIGSDIKKIHEAVPHVDATMELKFLLAKEMQVIMEFLDVDNKDDLENLRKEHKKIFNNIILFSDALLEGGKTDEGYINKLNDKNMLASIRSIKNSYKTEFNESINNVYKFKLKHLTASEENKKTFKKEMIQVSQQIIFLI